jgi:hypothetical protein
MVAARRGRCQRGRAAELRTNGALALIEACSADITAVRRENGTAEDELPEEREGIRPVDAPERG